MNSVFRNDVGLSLEHLKHRNLDFIFLAIQFRPAISFIFLQCKYADELSLGIYYPVFLHTGFFIFVELQQSIFP